MRIGLLMYIIGLEGIIINKRHIIQILIGIEIMLLGLIIISTINGVKLDDIISELYTIKILIIAGVESAIALTIIIGYYRIRGRIEW